MNSRNSEQPTSQILLIGDDPNMLRTLRRNLVGRGYDVHIAFDDQECFAMATDINPDLCILILDFTTVNLDGLSVCEQLRQRTSVPIIALSTIGFVSIIATQFTAISLIESIVVSPIIVGLTLFTISTTILVWIFRKGALAKPLFLILGALVLYLVRSIFWLFVDASLGSPMDGVIAIESFILCGAALILSRDLGSIDA